MAGNIYDKLRLDAGGIKQVLSFAKVVSLPDLKTPGTGKRVAAPEGTYAFEHAFLRDSGEIGVVHCNYGMNEERAIGYLEGAVNSMRLLNIEVRGWIDEQDRGFKGIEIERLSPDILVRWLTESSLKEKQESGMLKVQF